MYINTKREGDQRKFVSFYRLLYNLILSYNILFNKDDIIKKKKINYQKSHHSTYHKDNNRGICCVVRDSNGN